MFNIIRGFLQNESGATAIEYALIASLVAVATVTALTTLGTDLSTSFADVSAKL